jgi:hypothetical protein
MSCAAQITGEPELSSRHKGTALLRWQGLRNIIRRLIAGPCVSVSTYKLIIHMYTKSDVL